MTAYALFVTLALGILIGVIATVSIAVYMDGRTEKRIAAEKAAARRPSPDQIQKDLDRKRDDAIMDAAETLLRDKLGAEVISVEKTV